VDFTEIINSVDDSMRSSLRNDELQKYSAAYFADEYWKEDHVGVTGATGYSYDDPLHAERFRILASVISNCFARTTLIDVGCGPGLLIKNLLSLGFDCKGLEPSIINVLEASARFGSADIVEKIHEGCITSMPFRDDSFEIVVCLDVLEHLTVFDVPSALKELARVSSRFVLCSINSDNPYFYHPTILSRETWIALFEAVGCLQYCSEATDRIGALVSKVRPEYEFYLFSKASSCRPVDEKPV